MATVAELEKRIKKLEGEMTKLKIKNLKLSGLKVGDYFELAGLKWRILDKTEKGYHCLAEFLSDKKTFAEGTNNWTESSLREWLNKEILPELEKAVGENNLIEFERNLLSLDGRTEYGKCKDKVSLLTVDEYRKYRELIPNTDKWWWLITPWSTKENKTTEIVAVCDPSGFVSYYYCYGRLGVRPFCIFSSAIFESEE